MALQPIILKYVIGDQCIRINQENFNTQTYLHFHRSHYEFWKNTGESCVLVLIKQQEDGNIVALHTQYCNLGSSVGNLGETKDMEGYDGDPQEKMERFADHIREKLSNGYFDGRFW